MDVEMDKIRETLHIIKDKKANNYLSSLCMFLLILTRRLEALSDKQEIEASNHFLNLLKLKSETAGVKLIRHLNQKQSLYVAGHGGGICLPSTQQWLEKHAHTATLAASAPAASNPGDQKQELMRLYAFEKHHRRFGMKYMPVSGFHRLKSAELLLAMLARCHNTSEKSYFLVQLSSPLERRFHAVGCVITPSRMHWYDADAGIFSIPEEANVTQWLQSYFELARYMEKFSWFSIYRALNQPRLLQQLSLAGPSFAIPSLNPLLNQGLSHG